MVNMLILKKTLRISDLIKFVYRRIRFLEYLEQYVIECSCWDSIKTNTGLGNFLLDFTAAEGNGTMMKLR